MSAWQAVFGENWRMEGRFPSKSAPEHFWFFLPGTGKVTAPEREKPEVSFPSITPNPGAPAGPAPLCVDVCVCTDGEGRAAAKNNP